MSQLVLSAVLSFVLFVPAAFAQMPESDESEASHVDPDVAASEDFVRELREQASEGQATPLQVRESPGRRFLIYVDSEDSFRLLDDQDRALSDSIESVVAEHPGSVFVIIVRAGVSQQRIEEIIEPVRNGNVSWGLIGPGTEAPESPVVFQ